MVNFRKSSEKKITVTEAYLKLQHYCAYQERCTKEVIEKLKSFALENSAEEDIILRLKKEKYLNDSRFAEAFAGGKFRTKGWGKNKIRNELRQRGISEEEIIKAISNLENDNYVERLNLLLTKKNKNIKDENPLKRKQKLILFALGKGYEMDLILQVLAVGNRNDDF